LFPWFFGLLVPALIAALSGILCVVPAILFGLFIVPIYMVEGKRMLDVNKRSFEILKKDWALALVPPLLTIIPVVIVVGVLNFVFAFIPYAGGILTAALSGIVAATLGPFMAHLIFRIYVAIRERDEQRSIAHELQGAVGRA
jgi:hypothetical protein